MGVCIIENIELKYELRGKSLDELSNEDLDNIINDYYNNQIKIKDIIDKYNLGIQSNKLFKSFPPAVLKDVRCKYDNSRVLWQA